MDVRPSSTLLTLLVSAGFACGPGVQSQTSQPVAKPATLTRFELDAIPPGRNVLEAIRLLRSHWLANADELGEPDVVIDNRPAGGLSVLRDVRISQVEGVWLWSPADARRWWQTEHRGGVIEVQLTKQRGFRYGS